MSDCSAFSFVRRCSRPIGFVLGLGLAALATLTISVRSAKAQDQITVKLDQAQILRLPPHTSIVVLGNPIIADVTLLKKSNSMILTGKSFGETNLIALDDQGRTLGESTVNVVSPGNSMILQLGSAQQSYACDPHCQPTFDLGDDATFANGVSGQITARDKLAEPSH